MSLKQGIVVKNQFTIPQPDGSGTRGATPGQYVERYMARDTAVETVAPIHLFAADSYIEKYMARDEAVESTPLEDYDQLQPRMRRKGQGRGGVAFNHRTASMSDEELKDTSDTIQEYFDNGHTVLKTILSFSDEYLRRHGLIPEDFHYEKRGDYRGNLDQMKLRMAIMRGLERLEQQQYDDLRYVGVIQVDTGQVHCHLAMVDAGVGTIMPDGTQRGKIGPRGASVLRRGLDAYLDEQQFVRHLSSAVGYERRNVTSYVKRWAHTQMTTEALPQFLLATLPADRRLWRTSTNRPEMEKPNRIVREMVEDVLERPDSPLPQAMEKIVAYADQREAQEPGMSQAAYQQLLDTGRSQIVERGMNAVYASLRQLPDDMMRVRTPMLEVMSMDYDQIAVRAQDDAEDDLVGFGFRLRTYASRKQHHEQQRTAFHQKVRSWEADQDATPFTLPSTALYQLYLVEEEYHAKVMSKYQDFLPIGLSAANWEGRWQEITEYGQKLLSLESMRADSSLKRTKDPAEAERWGRMIYGQAGGHLVSQNDPAARQELARRVELMRSNYQDQIEDLRTTLASDGLQLEVTEAAEDMSGRKMSQDTARVVPGTEYPFDEVKGLDMHQMRYDFAADVRVGKVAHKSFVDMARRRQEALEPAIAYLEGSRQQHLMDMLPIADVTAMNRLADEFEQSVPGQAVLSSSIHRLSRHHQVLPRSATVELTDQVSASLEQSVYQEIDTYTFEPGQSETDISVLKQQFDHRAVDDDLGGLVD